MIRFFNSEAAFKVGSQVAPANVDIRRWDDLCKRQFLRVKAGANTTLSGVPNELTLGFTLAESAADRYKQYIDDKRRAMQYGNEKAGVFSTQYNFEKGYDGTVAQHNGKTYLQTLQNCLPSNVGELGILSHTTTAIDIKEEAGENGTMHKVIELGLDGSLCDTCALYEEFNAYNWWLYHFVNDQADRIFTYDPTKRRFGSLPSYQALVAKYNHMIWRSVYIFHTNTVREALAFEIGFACTLCDLPNGMTITATLTAETTNVPDGLAPNASTNELRMYNMGVTASAGLKGNGSYTVEIKRDNTVEKGDGAEEATEKDWDTYTVKITVPKMKQGDSIRGSFSLARGVHPYWPKLTIPDASKCSPTHSFQLDCVWEGNNSKIQRSEDLTIAALDWIDCKKPDDDPKPTEADKAAMIRGVSRLTLDYTGMQDFYRPEEGEFVEDIAPHTPDLSQPPSEEA